VHNIQLARLWNAKRSLFVEGDDVRVLRKFQDVLFGADAESIELIPALPVGGWTGWPYVIGSVMLMNENIGHDIASYALFDRDYHTPEQVTERQRDARRRAINLHIWSRKEIENFVIAPDPLFRLIKLRAGDRAPKEIRQKILATAGEFKDTVMDGFANEFLAQDRAAGLARANSRARELLANWDEYETRLALAPGKALLSKLSNWAKTEFDASFNAPMLAGVFYPAEVPPEIRGVLTAIIEGESFRKASADR
jgi:hypothetical protein